MCRTNALRFSVSDAERQNGALDSKAKREKRRVSKPPRAMRVLVKPGARERRLGVPSGARSSAAFALVLHARDFESLARQGVVRGDVACPTGAWHIGSVGPGGQPVRERASHGLGWLVEKPTASWATRGGWESGRLGWLLRFLTSKAPKHARNTQKRSEVGAATVAGRVLVLLPRGRLMARLVGLCCLVRVCWPACLVQAATFSLEFF